MVRVFALDRPGRPVAVIYLASSTSAEESKALAKTLFELHRATLMNPGLSGAALEQWRMNVHFDDYTGPQPWVAQEITGQPLPTNRQRRHAWRLSAGPNPQVIDDLTIPNL